MIVRQALALVREVRTLTISARLLFEPRDFWVGVYWDRPRGVVFGPFDLWVYVCLVPMLPLRIRVTGPYRL